jgi:transcription factor IIIB 90 kDa subunit
VEYIILAPRPLNPSSDMFQVNVFKLGHCFKALHEKVTLSKDGIQPVLPEDLIYRFAAKLEFGNLTSEVAETAVRLVKRMSKDWMVMGRRPSGVCGAALILAARMYNFRRVTNEVVYIVKVTTATIQKRLDEFKYTPSSNLTIEEFLSNEFLETAHDPPSFYEKSDAFQAQKKTRKRKRPLQLGEDEEGGRQQEEGEDRPQRQRSTMSSVTPEPGALPPGEYLRDDEGFLIPPPPRPRTIPIDPSLLAEDHDDPKALDALAAEHGGHIPLRISADEALEALTIEDEVSEMINDPSTDEHARAFATAEQRVLLHIARMDAIRPPKDVPMTESIADSEFEEDPEVKNCLLSEDESKIKEQIWLNANKDWVMAQQEKEFKRAIAQMGPPKATRKRIKRPRIGEGQTSPASSPSEAAVGVFKERTWSKRINYDAIAGLFEGSGSVLGSATTSRVTSRAGSTIADSNAGSAAGSIADGSDVGGSITGSSSVASSHDVGNALLGDLDMDEDLDDHWQEELEDI